ncbi:unnamed protein product [Brassica oleracea var. botrytis]
MGGKTHILQTHAEALFRGLKNDFPMSLSEFCKDV